MQMNPLWGTGGAKVELEAAITTSEFIVPSG